MKYYIDTNSQPFVFEDNATSEIITKVEDTHSTILTEITQADYEALTAPTLEQLIDKKISELTQAYKAEIEANVAYMNTIFQADTRSQDTITSVLSVGSVPDGFYWLDVANNKVTMTYTDLQGLAAAILARGQVAFDKLQGLKNQAREAASEDELNQIGW